MMHEGIVECSGLGPLHILDVVDQHTQAFAVTERVLGQFLRVSSPTASQASNPSEPWIEVSDVRSSWVMVVRNSVLAWLVASAWRLANCSSSSDFSLR
jgi:hypothetical protein